MSKLAKLEVHHMSHLHEMPIIECDASLKERVKMAAVKSAERKRLWMQEVWDELAEYEMMLFEKELKKMKHEGEHGCLIPVREWFGLGRVNGYRVKQAGCVKKIWKSLMGCLKKK